MRVIPPFAGDDLPGEDSRRGRVDRGDSVSVSDIPTIVELDDLTMDHFDVIWEMYEDTGGYLWSFEGTEILNPFEFNTSFKRLFRRYIKGNLKKRAKQEWHLTKAIIHKDKTTGKREMVGIVGTKGPTFFGLSIKIEIRSNRRNRGFAPLRETNVQPLSDDHTEEYRIRWEEDQLKPFSVGALLMVVEEANEPFNRVVSRFPTFESLDQDMADVRAYMVSRDMFFSSASEPANYWMSDE